MMQVLSDWYQRNFSDPQAVILALLLLTGFAVLFFFGGMLAPFLASVVIAYLLDGIIRPLVRIGIPRPLAMTGVFTLFLTLLVFLFIGLLPLLSAQIVQLVKELPNMVAKGQLLMLHLPEQYPHLFSAEQLQELMATLRTDITQIGQKILSLSLTSIPILITLVVYMILVPILVFFLLKDGQAIIEWLARYLPRRRRLVSEVWAEMDRQIGNYVRGKILEILIVGVITYIAFAIMGLNYAPLLAALVGISVLIPFVGVAVVTFPVALIAYFQWGWGDQFLYLMIVYTVIQVLDGNVLVPLLFSEAVNLHPVAIILAVLVFGGLWGFWGIFFAIPLATLVKAVLNAWPRQLVLAPDLPG